MTTELSPESINRIGLNNPLNGELDTCAIFSVPPLIGVPSFTTSVLNPSSTGACTDEEDCCLLPHAANANAAVTLRNPLYNFLLFILSLLSFKN